MEKRLLFTMALFLTGVFSLSLAITSYVDPVGFPAPWPDNPSQPLASYEFNSLNDLIDYYPTNSWNPHSSPFCTSLIVIFSGISERVFSLCLV